MKTKFFLLVGLLIVSLSVSAQQDNPANPYPEGLSPLDSIQLHLRRYTNQYYLGGGIAGAGIGLKLCGMADNNNSKFLNATSATLGIIGVLVMYFAPLEIKKASKVKVCGNGLIYYLR